MASHQIVSVNKCPCKGQPNSKHILKVAVPGVGKPIQVFSVDHVLMLMGQGDRFFTVSASTKKQATILRVPCGFCARDYIKSAADAVTDNNLENMPEWN